MVQLAHLPYAFPVAALFNAAGAYPHCAQSSATRSPALSAPPQDLIDNLVVECPKEGKRDVVRDPSKVAWLWQSSTCVRALPNPALLVLAAFRDI